eukprot:1044833-Heterocapsa_arctica.AAC.1
MRQLRLCRRLKHAERPRLGADRYRARRRLHNSPHLVRRNSCRPDVLRWPSVVVQPRHHRLSGRVIARLQLEPAVHSEERLTRDLRHGD